MNEQRAAVPFLPGLTRSSKQPPELLQRLSVATNNEEHFPDESFFEMLMKCQGSRIEEQRSSLPNGSEIQDPILLHARNATASSGSKNGTGETQPAVPLPPHAPTVPDEDFFSLIQRLQAGRLEDQRAVLPTENPSNGSAKVPSQKNGK
jgi:G-protein signaling modulator 2